jgi:phosphohistidine phosphatase SixA
VNPPSADVIWLVRHGQSAANAGLATEHPATIALTTLGHKQSAQVAQQLPRSPDWVAISPFQRTADSAAPCIARFPQVQVFTWPIQELTYLSPRAAIIPALATDKNGLRLTGLHLTLRLWTEKGQNLLLNSWLE